MHHLPDPVVHLEPRFEEPQVVIEMLGSNLVVRATERVGRTYTTSLADVLNAAADSDTNVVIDPEPFRCDGAFAAYHDDTPRPPAGGGAAGQPLPAEVAAAGIIRVRAERGTWLIDVGRGRLCRSDTNVDVRFLGDAAWHAIVAVCVTPTRLVALGVDGGQISADRARRAA